MFSSSIISPKFGEGSSERYSSTMEDLVIENVDNISGYETQKERDRNKMAFVSFTQLEYLPKS